jgi:hypothetical protein
MAKRDVTTLFKSLLLQFIGEEDPLLSMLRWTTQQLMQVEAVELPRFHGHIRACVLGNAQVLGLILDRGLEVQCRMSTA